MTTETAGAAPRYSQMLESFARGGTPGAAGPTTLVAIPPAGYGAARFARWPAVMPAGLALVAVRLPGRERLISSPAPSDARQLVEMITAAVTRHVRGPYLLFGECSGAILAFEMARRLRHLGRPLPEHLFVASQVAPHRVAERASVSGLGTEDFFAELRGRGMLPGHLTLGHPLWRMMERTIRADLAAIEEYHCAPGPPLPIPISAIRGRADHKLRADDVMAWREFTTRAFNYREIQSGHLTTENSAEILDIISQAMRAAGARES